MERVILLCKFCFVLLSFAGLTLFANTIFKIDIALSPFVAASYIIFSLLVGGYINCLPETVWLLYGIGWIGFVVFFYHNKFKSFLRTAFTPQIVFLFLLIAIFILIDRNAIFHISDELSHWGTVIKEICSLNEFPDARTVIDYKEYPLSMALFSYFFLHITGFSQSICYMAYGVYISSGIVAFAYGTKWKIRDWFMLTVFGLIFLWASNSFFISLLVDPIIPLAAVALFILLLENKDSFCGDPLKFGRLILPIAISLSMIKTDAGLIYSFIILFAGSLYHQGKQSGAVVQRSLPYNIKTLAVYASPVFAFFLWKKYIDKVYLGNGYSTVKFALSKDNLLKNYAEKSSGRVIEIMSDLFRNAFCHPFFIAIVILAAILLLLIQEIRNDDEKRIYYTVSALAFVMWFVFIIGYGLMLVFLMPEWEFKAYGYTMIGFERYVGTVAGCSVGILGYCIIRICRTNVISRKKMMGTVVITSLLVVGFRIDPLVFFNYEVLPETELLYQFEAQIPGGLYLRDNRLVIYGGEYSEGDSWVCLFHLERQLLNKNIYYIDDYNTERDCVYYERLDVYSEYFDQGDYLFKISGSEMFYDLIDKLDIRMDEDDGIIYRIDHTEENEVELIKIK